MNKDKLDWALLQGMKMGLPLSIELRWTFMRNTHFLAIKVMGAMRGIKICLVEEFNIVSFQTDAKFVEQLIHNDNFLGRHVL